MIDKVYLVWDITPYQTILHNVYGTKEHAEEVASQLNRRNTDGSRHYDVDEWECICPTASPSDSVHRDTGQEW